MSKGSIIVSDFSFCRDSINTSGRIGPVKKCFAPPKDFGKFQQVPAITNAPVKTTIVQLKFSHVCSIFASNEVGRKKQKEVKTRKVEEIRPLIIDQEPKFQGPYRNVSLETVTLNIIGIAQEIEQPIVEIYVIAENAVSLIRGKQTSMESITKTKKILFKGN